MADEQELGPELHKAKEVFELEETDIVEQEGDSSEGEEEEVLLLLFRLKFRLLAGLGKVLAHDAFVVFAVKVWLLLAAEAAAAQAVGAMGLCTTVLLL